MIQNLLMYHQVLVLHSHLSGLNTYIITYSTCSSIMVYVLKISSELKSISFLLNSPCSSLTPCFLFMVMNQIHCRWSLDSNSESSCILNIKVGECLPVLTYLCLLLNSIDFRYWCCITFWPFLFFKKKKNGRINDKQ